MTNSNTEPMPTERRRWPLIAAVLAVVLLVVVAVLVFGWPRRVGGLAIGPRPAWQPPPQTQLSSSMHVPPVPGWRLRATDLGLPTRFATSDDPQFADPSSETLTTMPISLRVVPLPPVPNGG